MSPIMDVVNEKYEKDCLVKQFYYQRNRIWIEQKAENHENEQMGYETRYFLERSWSENFEYLLKSAFGAQFGNFSEGIISNLIGNLEITIYSH